MFAFRNYGLRKVRGYTFYRQFFTPLKVAHLHKRLYARVRPRVTATPNASSAGARPRPPPRRLRYTVAGLFFIYVALSFAIRFGYEPLRDYGFFDNIAQATIFSVVPTKKVRKPREKNNAIAPPSLYQPITEENEIRLLVLEPGRPGDELKCRLSNVKLSWRTKYEALSYTWGDESLTAPLDCSGHKIDITFNLRDALTDLRYAYHTRVLWVDAVCINQKDKKEKERQIPLMGPIYSQARRVLIYLGKEDDSVRDAMAQIRSLDWKLMPLHIQRYYSRLGALGHVGNFIIDSMPNMQPILEGNVNWEQTINLLRRPWFQRTWIIQEAILARRARVICGDQSVSWFKFERVVNSLFLYSSMVGPIPDFSDVTDAVKGVNMMRSARRNRYRFILNEMAILSRISLFRNFDGWKLDEFSHLLDLLIETRTFKCDNARDKIFGTLGIVQQDISSELVKPNYDISVADVYRNMVVWDIFTNRSLRVLGCLSDKTNSAYSLPSWVPDFTQLENQPGLLRLQNRAAYSASRDTPIQARLSQDKATLYLKGRAVDTLHTVGRNNNDLGIIVYIPSSLQQRLEGRKIGRTWYHVLRIKEAVITEAINIWIAASERKAISQASFVVASRKAAPSRVLAGKKYPAEWESFWRALVCNRTRIGLNAPASLGAAVTAYTRLVTEGMSINEAFIDKWLDKSQTIEQSIASSSSSRRFAGTEQGLVGWVPTGTRKGDIIVIIYGSKVPFVLRKEKHNNYRLLGECYIQGLMDGEAISAPGMEQRETEFALG